MKDFKTYLARKGLVGQTVMLYVREVKSWLSWLNKPTALSGYEDVMNYIGYLQSLGMSVGRINKILRSIGHYYEYKELENVALSIRLKGEIQKAVLPALSEEELNKLYEVFEVERVNNKRSYFYQSDKLILGLMIYQGLEFRDLLVLEKGDVDLEKGKIYIPSRRSRLSRLLELRSCQILSFHEYLEKWRINYKSIESEKLFLPQAGNYDLIKNQLSRLSAHVKREAMDKLGLKVYKLNHLRQSRIAIWIEELGLRQAQYNCGFKTIRSVERYKKGDLKDLQSQIKIHHPLS